MPILNKIVWVCQTKKNDFLGLLKKEKKEKMKIKTFRARKLLFKITVLMWTMYSRQTMETTTCGSTAAMMYFILLYCKSTTGCCEQDADLTFTAPCSRLACLGHALMLRDALVEKSSSGSLTYSHILWFCLSISENKQNKPDLSCCSTVLLAHSLSGYDWGEYHRTVTELSTVTDYLTSTIWGTLKIFLELCAQSTQVSVISALTTSMLLSLLHSSPLFLPEA